MTIDSRLSEVAVRYVRVGGIIVLALLTRLVPKRATRILLHSPSGLDDGMIAIAEGLRDRRWQVFFLAADSAAADRIRPFLPRTVTIVAKRSLNGLWCYLTARFIFMTHGLYGDLSPPRKQTVINLWHGEPGGKLIGRFNNEPAVRCSVAPVTSPVGRALRAASFDLHPKRVPITGAPRNDRMLQATKADVRARLGLDKQHVVLWLPTFRRAAFPSTVGPERLRHDGCSERETLGSGLAELAAYLDGSGTQVVLKPHPHGRDVWTAVPPTRILDEKTLVGRRVTSYELLAAADCLVTDASSVWQDFLLLNRPMICHFPDIDDYRRERGLNLEPYELWFPGPVVRTYRELAQEIMSVVRGRDMYEQRRDNMRGRLHKYHDAGSTRRLLTSVGLRP